MLHLTSILFATVVVHAHHAQETSYHHIFLLVTVLSILFHSTKDPVVGAIDKIAAHLAFVFVL
jgi:hypothetical protein